MPVKKYNPKRQVSVDAIFVTKDNLEEVANFCGGGVADSNHGACVEVPCLVDTFDVFQGEYLYRDCSNGRFSKASKDDFEGKYEESPFNQFHDHGPGVRRSRQL